MKHNIVSNINALAGQRVRELSKVNIWHANSYLLLDWLICAAAIGLSVWTGSRGLYILSVALIGARQHALLIVVHEGAHYRLSKKRALNDLISNFFAAFPIFFCTQGYRANHLAHHQFLNHEGDPDWTRKIHLPEWQFPKTVANLLLTLIKVFFTSWYKMILLFWSLSGIGKLESWTRPAKRRLLIIKISYYLSVGAAITATGTWTYFVMFWLVPFFFVMPLVERVRSISEHFALDYEHELHYTRNILCSPVESFFFGPHNIRYHLDHHLFPTVPQYNLPRLHSYLMSFPEYVANAHQNESYFVGNKSVLTDILQEKKNAQTEV